MLEEGHLHIILNEISPLTLDLSGMDNTSVLVWQFHGGDNQRVRSPVTPSILPASVRPRSPTVDPNPGSRRHLDVQECPQREIPQHRRQPRSRCQGHCSRLPDALGNSRWSARSRSSLVPLKFQPQTTPACSRSESQHLYPKLPPEHWPLRQRSRFFWHSC